MVLRLNMNRNKPQVNRKFNICVIPGDGIGIEVMPEAINILRVVEKNTISNFHLIQKTGVVNASMKRER